MQLHARLTRKVSNAFVPGAFHNSKAAVQGRHRDLSWGPGAGEPYGQACLTAAQEDWRAELHAAGHSLLARLHEAPAAGASKCTVL